MAINPQKLLPPAKLSTGERMAASYDKKIDDLLNFQIKKKLINVDKLVNNTKKVKEKTKKQKKTRKENEEREKKEGRLEQKQPKEASKLNLPGLPKTGFLDSVQNFIGYTFLGYLFTNYSNNFPALIGVVKQLPAAMDTFGNIIRGTVDLAAGIIEGGYKFKNDLRQKVDELGGKDAQKTFDKFIVGFKDMINSIMTLGLYKPPKEKTPVPRQASGGYVRKMVPGGNVPRAGRPVSGPVSRQIQKVETKKIPIVYRQISNPGKDIGGREKIETIFPSSKDPKTPGPLNTLVLTSSTLSKVPLIGPLMGAAVDIAMGQKPDKRIYRTFGDSLAYMLSPSINAQANTSVENIASTIAAMAEGGTVTRGITRKGTSVEQIGLSLANLFQNSIEGRLAKIFGEILKTKQASLAGGEVPPAEISEDTKNAANELIDYFSKLYGRNAAIGIVANLLRESGLRTYAPEGGFHGMAQWDDNRWSRLTTWAQSKGKDPMKRSTQAEMIALELNEMGTGNRLKQTTTPEEAASLFYNEFERAAYSKPIVGNAYTPDNPHEQKNRAFIATLTGASYKYVQPGKIKPVITGRFGDLRTTGVHGGTDLAAPSGTPLRAISDGRVIESGEDPGGWGYYLVFKDNRGIYHLYGHMPEKVKTGSFKQGDIIGMVGSTGRTNGPHLHWETGTGWNGTITGKFNPLSRYSENAPFSTRKEEKTKIVKPKKQATSLEKPSSAEVASSKPKIMDAAQQIAMEPSYATTGGETTFVMLEKILLKEVTGPAQATASVSSIDFPRVNSTIPFIA